MKALSGMAGYTVAPCRWPRAWHRRREAANGVSFTTVCPLVVTDARGAEQAWMFEARPRVHVDGIPMGRVPSGFFLIGTREQCEGDETVRAEPRGSVALELESNAGARATEPCKGPLCATDRHWRAPAIAAEMRPSFISF